MFFKLDFFTITDFGDDGSVAGGGSGTKSVIFIIPQSEDNEPERASL